MTGTMLHPLSARNFYTFKISTFDKSSIPTLAHSRMEIASLSFPLYSYPLTTSLSRRTRTRTRRHLLDIPEWFTGNHDKLLVLQYDARNIYSTPGIETGSRPISSNRSRAPGNAWPNPSIHCSCLWRRTIAKTASS